MAKNRIITVQDIPITVSEMDTDDYICITDMATAKSDSSRAADVIKNWLRNRNTLEFLGTWEQIGGTFAHKDIAFEFVSNRSLSQVISADYFRRKRLSQSAVDDADAHYIG